MSRRWIAGASLAALAGAVAAGQGPAPCPNVFRHDGRWYMLYAGIRNEVGYETRLAASDDLLRWKPLGTVRCMQLV